MELTWKKVAGSILGLAAVSTCVALLVKYYKKEMHEIEENDKALEKEAEDAGFSLEKVIDEVARETEVENHFIKAVTSTVFFNPEINSDIISMGKGLVNCPNLIHVVVENYNNQRYLNFMFELPDLYVRQTEEEAKKNQRGSTKGARGKSQHPNLSDYIREIRQMAINVNDDIIKGPQVCVKPELYMRIKYIEYNGSWDNPGDIHYAYLLIPSESYKDAYGTKETDINGNVFFRHDGLFEFYKDIIQRELTTKDNDGNPNTDNFKIFLRDQRVDAIGRRLEHFECLEPVIMIKVAYKIANVNGGAGVRYSNVPAIIKRFCEDLVIEKQVKDRVVMEEKFEHVFFHPKTTWQQDEGEIACAIYEYSNDNNPEGEQSDDDPEGEQSDDDIIVSEYIP